MRCPVRWLLVLILSGLQIINLGCGPDDRSNPLDSVNPDAFGVQAEFDTSGMLVTWQQVPVSGIASYSIYRSDRPDITGTVVGTVAKGTTSFIDGNVWLGQSYYFRVVARDKHGNESKASEPDSAEALGARLRLSHETWPAAPSGDSIMLGISNDSTVCKFSWTIQSTAPTWLTASASAGSSGDSVEIRALTNAGVANRSGLLIVSAPGVLGTPETLSVSQGPSSVGPVLVLSRDSVRLPGLGGMSEPIGINIQNGQSGQFVLSPGASWITVDPVSGSTPNSFTVSGENNFGPAVRDGWILAQAAGVPGSPETLYVHQPRMAWQPLGAGMDDWVYALTVFDNDLIAGGLFDRSDEVQVNHIAGWDGLSWVPLSSGVDGTRIRTLTVFRNELIAGGLFATASGELVNNIASWNGVRWSPLGLGFDSAVSSLTVYDNQLIAGGKFTTAGITPVHHIARWDGTTWTSLGSGFDEDVIALTVYNDQLIAGGKFSNSGGTPVNHIAIWNRLSWSALGSGLGSQEDEVVVLTTYNDRLIAGGAFLDVGSVRVNNIAGWNGSTWSPLGAGMQGNRVTAMVVLSDQLFVAGMSDNSIMSWNGTFWTPLNPDMDAGYFALTAFGNQLVAGGQFNFVGGVSSNNVAILKELDN